MKVPTIKFVGERRDFLQKATKAKKVLHLGCVEYPMTEPRIRDGSHLHLLLSRVTSELWGIDLDSKGLQLLSSYGLNHLVEGNLYDMKSLNLPTDFDIILAGEILEHLENPGLFLKELRGISGPDALIILSTPNAYSAKQFIHVLLGYDNIEPSHVAVWGFSTLHRLLKDNGFHISDWFTALHTQLSARSRIAEPIFSIICRWFPQVGDDLIVTCRVCRQ